MEDPGWGGYVPSPEEGDGRQPPAGGEGSGSQPPGDRGPWWRRNIVLGVAAVVVLLLVAGGTVRALSKGPNVGPTPGPTITTPGPVITTPGPVVDSSAGPVVTTNPPTTSGPDPFIAFAAHANSICNRFKRELVNDWNTGSASLLQDTKDLISALMQLGTPTTGADQWAEGLVNWRQAASFLIDTGDPQDWQINIMAGGHNFRDMGIQACGSYGSWGL